MKTMHSSRRHYYLSRISIFLTMAALLVAMVGCDQSTPPPIYVVSPKELEKETGELAKQEMLDEIEKKAPEEYEEVKQLLDALKKYAEEKVLEKGLESAEKVAKDIIDHILRIFIKDAAKYVNVMWYIWMQAGKTGNALGHWIVDKILEGQRERSWWFFNEYQGYDQLGEIADLHIGVFPYVIDWQVIIKDKQGNPVSARYKLRLAGAPEKKDTNERIRVPNKKDWSGTTSGKGYHHGTEKYCSNNWPYEVRSIRVEGYLVDDIFSFVKVSIRGKPGDEDFAIIFRVVVKIIVHENSSEDAFTTSSVALSSASTVKGYVLDRETGVPIPDAIVSVGNDTITYWANQTYSDENGYYEIATITGDLVVGAWTDGYYYDEIEFSIAELETKWINITLKRFPIGESSVQGYIRDLVTNGPIPGAPILVYGYDYEGYVWSNYTWTNIDGYYEIKTISGDLSILVRHYKFYESALNFSIADNETKWMNHVLQFIPDVGVVDVEPSSIVVDLGNILPINVTIKNGLGDWGTASETFNVTVYTNLTEIGTQEITLSGGNSTTIIFAWDTTGFAVGEYTISAYAWPVPGETDTADNTLVNGSVLVTLLGGVEHNHSR